MPNRLPARWQPPTAFPMQIWYGPYRRPVQLWTTPELVDEQGRVVLYLAIGPAGVPVMESSITDVRHKPLPPYARVKVVIDQAPDGQVVFGQARHTMN
jgi:hypothetical protein